MRAILAVALLCTLVAPVLAAEVAGVKIDETAKAADGKTLQLNGAGVRTRFFVKVYVGALYLAQKANSASAVLADAGAKRVELHLLRDLRADQVSSALNEGLLANNSVEDLAKLDAKIKDFVSIMNSIGSAKQGSVIALDYAPGPGTRVNVNGEVKGTVPGEDFNRALLRVWLGDKPVDTALKKGMLGQ
jgi:Chalcone isomerase-like